MAKRSPGDPLTKPRVALIVTRSEATQRVDLQIERAKSLPNVQIGRHDGAHRWYDFTAELLRLTFSTDQIHDEFVGMGSYDDDTSVHKYLGRLISIRNRLELYPEDVPVSSTPILDHVTTLDRLFERFHAIATQLTHRYAKRPTLQLGDEHDVQDLLHALLRLYFDDVRPEEWTPSYAGGSSRMDFLLKPQQTVIEAKMTRDGLATKEVRDQLAIDIQNYRSHQDCKTLVCFVYDPRELVLNPRGIEDDLSRSQADLVVRVRIVRR